MRPDGARGRSAQACWTRTICTPTTTAHSVTRVRVVHGARRSHLDVERPAAADLHKLLRPVRARERGPHLAKDLLDDPPLQGRPVAMVYGSAHWIVVRGYQASAAPASSGDGTYSITAFDVNNPWPPTPMPGPPPPHAAGDVCGSGGTRGVADEHISYATWQTDYMTGIPERVLGGQVRRRLRPRATRRHARSRPSTEAPGRRPAPDPCRGRAARARGHQGIRPCGTRELGESAARDRAGRAPCSSSGWITSIASTTSSRCSVPRGASPCSSTWTLATRRTSRP